MEETMLGGEQTKVNSDFYKKLQQQIVQKENIIQLLKLKVKNLEEEVEHPQGNGSGQRLDDSELAKRVQGLERTINSLQEENDTLARRASKDESAIEDLEARLTLASDEISTRDSELHRLSSQQGGPEDRKYDKLWSQIRDLEAKVSTKDEEISRLRRELSDASPPGETSRELSDLRREATQLREEKTGLEETIGRLKETGPRDELLEEELQVRDEKIRAAELEASHLKEEVDRLQGRLADARAAAENSAPAGSFQLVSSIITLFQRLQELRDGVGPRREFLAVETSLSEVSEQIGLEKVKSVGRKADPELHQVTEVVYSTTHPHDTIIREISQGYTARSSVVKLAEVVVSRNPFWCPKCEKVAAEGSRYCNICGEKVAGRESPDIMVMDPTLTTRSFLDLAAAKEESGDHEGAEKTYLHVLEMEPGNAPALWGLVTVRESQGRYRDALTGLEQLKGHPVTPGDLTRTRHRISTKMEIVERLQALV